MDDLISRQAAIDAICGECQGNCIPCEHYPCGEIKALEQLPSVQPGYKLDEWCEDCKEYDKERHCCPRFNRVIRNTMDEVQPEQKVGKWLKISPAGIYECSECGQAVMTSDIEAYKYCHGCGVKMEG